jgi:predicted transposase/invertase (TIGR01784 family)
MAYLDPKNDLTFKKVFVEHLDLLKSLLNALLPLKEGRIIEHLENLSANLIPQVPTLGNQLLNVRCVDNRGSSFLVAIQMLWTNNFKARVRLDAAKAYVKPMHVNGFVKDLEPIYALYFVNETFQTNETLFYHHYPIANIEGTEQLINGLELLFIELPHFRLPATVEKEMAMLWLRYFTEIGHGTPDAPGVLLQNEETKEALGMLQESALTPAEREDYDRCWDEVAKERTIRDELIRQAIMQVKKEELEKGVRIQKIDTALKMIAKNFDDETISEFIELDVTEIQTLRRTGTLD